MSNGVKCKLNKNPYNFQNLRGEDVSKYMILMKVRYI